MNITIFLNTGQSFTADVTDYNSTEFAASLNNPQILMINIGDIILNKHIVQMILPSEVVSKE